MTTSTPAPWPTLAELAGTCKPIPGFSSYVASDRGYVCSVDRVVGTRRLKGVVLKPRVAHNGYALVNLTDDQGRRQTRTVHSLVLLACAGPPKPGQETLHGKGGPLDNRYPENIGYGTRSQNELDKVAAGTASTGPVLSYPCLNECGALVTTEGRRCLDCVRRVGQEGAAMLRRGVNLCDVADHFGYTNVDWVWKLAKEAGWPGTKREALTQRPKLSQRVMATLRGQARREAARAARRPQPVVTESDRKGGGDGPCL